ncbi:MAG: DUF2218 domain-containing protein [Pseudomonadota bacterium]
MTVTVTGHASCEKSARYVQQLIKHWAHKFDAVYADGFGEVPFSQTTHATFEARENGIAIRLTSIDSDESEEMRSVIEDHLDRFAFREAPLDYKWNTV